MRFLRMRLLVFSSLVCLLLGTLGCATKNWVQSQAITPLDAKITGVDKKVDQKTNELDGKVTDLDRKTEQGISSAQNKADAAGQDAQKAKDAAQSAQQTANKGVSDAAAAHEEIENADNYQAVKTGAIQFALGRSDLTADDKATLDSLSSTLSGLKHYAVEVRGFTDATGDKQYNLELSRRRADAVVRYLTENAQVPLVKIHTLGLGEDQPASDNKTTDGRKQNRRVEVRIMAPQLATQASAGGQQTTASVPTAQ